MPNDPTKLGFCSILLDRLHPGPRRRYALRRSSARRLRPRPGKKLPPARRGILPRLVQRLLHSPAHQDAPCPVWNELLSHTVAGSVSRGLIPHTTALTFAGDGTHLESGCYSHGHKTCNCPRSQRCNHPRRYTDPGALNGWDSYRSRWVVGRMLYTLAELESGQGLPIWLALGPGNRHDSLSGALAVDHACRYHAKTGLILRHGLFDAAHEGAPFLHLCYHHRIDPIVARGKAAKPKPKLVSRLARDGIHLSPKGVPICQADLPMHSRGHSKPHVWAWTCPRAGQCPAPCRFAQHTLCLNAKEDPRALTPAPTATKTRAESFKRRTARRTLACLA